MSFPIALTFSELYAYTDLLDKLESAIIKQAKDQKEVTIILDEIGRYCYATKKDTYSEDH